MQEVRSGRSGALAILLMVLSFYILNKKDLGLQYKIFLSSFLCGIASLTHPAISFLMFGYLLNILFNKKYYNNRIKILSIFVLGASIAVIPYLIYVSINFETWRSQFLAHSAGSTGGFNSLSILNNFLYEFKYKPFLLILLLLSFLSPIKAKFESVLIPFCGLLFLGLISNQPFYKFILPIAYISTFSLLPSVVDSFFTDRFRILVFKLIISLCLINFLIFPLARTILTYSQYQLRDPSNIDNVIAKYVPQHSKALSIPIAYYSCMKRDIDFRYPGPLFGLRIEKNEKDLLIYKSAVEKYRPSFLILDSNSNPKIEFNYLSNASYVKLFRYQVDLRNRLNPGTGSIDFTIWKVDYLN